METGTTAIPDKPLKGALEQATEDRANTIYENSTDACSGSSIPHFQPTLEKSVNHDLSTNFPDSLSFQQHEMDTAPPPPISTPRYIPPSRWSQGIHIPLPIAILLLLLLFLETCTITFYTAVALYSTLPAAGFPQRDRTCAFVPPSAAQLLNIYVGNAERPASPEVQSPAASVAVSSSVSVVTVTATPTQTSSSTSTTSSAVEITPSIVLSTVFSTKDVGPTPTGV